MIQDNDAGISTQIYCPNCGHMNLGHKDEEGRVKFKCDRCGLVLVRTKINRKNDLLNLKYPKMK